MISAVQLALDNFARGWPDAGQQVLDELQPGARYQVELRFDEIAAVCCHRMTVSRQPRPGNRVCVEHVAPLPRCVRQSPDGRGAAWLASGGDMLAYGVCCLAGCPLGTEQ